MARFDMPLNTNDQSIDRVLNSGLPVALVLYSGSLDAALDEALRQVAKADAGQLLVARLDAQANPRAAAQNSGPLPALIGYRDGQETDRAAVITPSSFRAHVDYLLGRGSRPVELEPVRAQAAAASGKPVVVTDATFQAEVVNSDLPVVVDLWAPWCTPCRMIAPVLEKLAKEYAGQMKIAKVNVDENPRTSSQFNVRSIPTLLVFRDGKIVDRVVGAAPEPALRQRLQSVLAVH
ncbi:MAG TPA: thioredoxin [Aggregatilinea sp.]|uniref:thioredoxin n=1 Tax=Aggregatilinea sp. TaxID=2806333 RepID=UPI002C30694E|nr:thioredoxin [Aggregatilinea sp.]HML24329.1 thioredoxin [Aggregatilinea sp.]